MSKPTYEQGIAAFDWADALDDLGWSGESTVNLAGTIVDRHAQGAATNRIAVLWVGGDGRERRITFGELSRESIRVANLLRRLGVRKGDRVAGILPRIPETISIIVGALRAGAIYVPIFAGFSGEAVKYRLCHSGAKIAFVAARSRHLVSSNAKIPVIVVGSSDIAGGDIDYHGALLKESETGPSERYDRNDPAMIIYTSGSTGQPKGCLIAANLLAAMWPYARYGLDLKPDDDLFWPTGDPSWGYGLCCYLPALAAGGFVLCVEANATAKICLDILRRYKVTNLATTPTVLRSLMAEGDAARSAGLSMRVVSSCGEPLNGEVVEFFQRAWGPAPMDHFGATEFGLPIGNQNALAMPVKPGSMGLPAPGQQMAIVDEDGQELGQGSVGLIAQRNSENSRYWLRYWNDEKATAALYRGSWTCTGDLGFRDNDGYFWFKGRSDDIIKSSGYRIGPFEIESALLRHEAVVEAAVIGVPDSVRGEAIKAFVVTRSGVERSEGFVSELVELVKSVCGRHQSPREIEFVDSLPKTQTGKIQRFLLRQAAFKDKALS